MARTKGSVDKAPRKPRSDKKDRGPANATPGHNSEGAPETTGASTLTDDEQRALFVNGLSELETLIQEKDSVVAKIRNKRQQLEARSFSKDDVDFGLALRKGDEKAIVKKRQREQQIARWLNHPVAQLDLFVDGKSDPTPIDDRAFEEGKISGMEGKSCVPPSTYAPQTQPAQKSDALDDDILEDTDKEQPFDADAGAGEASSGTTH
jgi:hypothetical protein